MRKETGKLSEKIRQIQKGNKEEIVEVINQFDPLIKKYQRILYKDAAEDVNAEMVLALWEAVLRIKCIESEAQCAKYLMNALKNKFFELYRKSRHKNDNETQIDEFIGYILTVLVAMCTDYLIYELSYKLDIKIGVNTLFGAIVCIWFILNEALSILENAGRMGVKIPTFLYRVISDLQKKVDDNNLQ